MKTNYRQILVHIDNTRRSDARLALARHIAHVQDASVAAVHAAQPGYYHAARTLEAGEKLATVLNQQHAERRAEARERFDEALAEGSPRATWVECLEADVIRAFSQQALYADLLVLGQPDPADPSSGEVPADFAPSVMAQSGRPALMAPYVGAVPASFDTVAVAWKASREAAAALTAALPLLQRARHVVVMRWNETPEAPRASGSILGLERFLKLHGVAARFDDEAPASPDLVGELMLSRCTDHGADLLVMGCYGHARLREWLLGGASRTVMRSMTLPVLMSH